MVVEDCTSPRNNPTGPSFVDKPDTPDVLAALSDKIGVQQKRIRDNVPELHGRIDRGQHQKQLLGAFGALRILDAIPAKAKAGPFASPETYTVACRISNGQPCPAADRDMDVRGLAIKFFTTDGHETDLLATNEGGRSHARDATAFLHLADIIVELIIHGIPGFVRASLMKLFGGALHPFEHARGFWIIFKATKLRKVESIALERFWGSVVELGGAPIKYSFQPHPSAVPGCRSDRLDPDYLRVDLESRLTEGPLKFQLCLQFFVDEKTTPVNDASVVWPEDAAPLIPVGELEIAQCPSTDDEHKVRKMAFNPGHGFEPLGITHARRAVYAASARNRDAMPSEEARFHLSERAAASRSEAP